MQVELNIPLPTDPRRRGGAVLAAARGLRKMGFTPVVPAKVDHRVATGEYLLVVRGTYNDAAQGGYTGVNGAVRALCDELDVEPISMLSRPGQGPRWFCKDFSDERDGKTDPVFIVARPADGLVVEF